MVCDCEEKKERRGFWTLFVTASFFVGLWFCRGWIDSFEFCFGFLTVRWCAILVYYIYHGGGGKIYLATVMPINQSLSHIWYLKNFKNYKFMKFFYLCVVVFLF